MKVRILLATSLVAASVLAVPTSAMAGEITGPPEGGFATGGSTPIVDGVPNTHSPNQGPVASSECAFSGLNAYHPAGGGFPEKQPAFPTVQSYGMFVSNGIDPGTSPGEACRGN